MRFWDASALVPLLLNEKSTPDIRTLLRADEALAVWWGTRIEVVSALARRAREHGGALRTDRARRALDLMASRWTEMEPTDGIRTRAEQLLFAYPLCTGDALQLAAGIAWSDGTPAGRGFVSLDQRLREAALHEGFTLLP